MRSYRAVTEDWSICVYRKCEKNVLLFCVCLLLSFIWARQHTYMGYSVLCYQRIQWKRSSVRQRLICTHSISPIQTRTHGQYTHVQQQQQQQLSNISTVDSVRHVFFICMFLHFAGVYGDVIILLYGKISDKMIRYWYTTIGSFSGTRRSCGCMHVSNGIHTTTLC